MLPAWANMKHISYGDQVQVGSAATLATYDGAPKMELLGVSWPPLMHAKSIKSPPNTIARGCAHGEPAQHGVLDMGVDESKPQELPGMEVDPSQRTTDLNDLLKTMTRDAKDEMSTVNWRL